MALFMKQDFAPPVLSMKWIAFKLRPNMLLYSREHIISILESGLLFREDSIEVEQEAPATEVYRAAGGGGWLTRGERVLSIALVCACVALLPPKRLSRATLAHAAGCACVPVAIRTYHRCLARPRALMDLLNLMRDYLALVRRAAACLKECSTVVRELESFSATASCARALLCRQQAALAVLLTRASSALLGNAPWLRSDVAWDAVEDAEVRENFIKIHHAFLVVQSTLLKHIAMAHYIPSVNAQRLYKNHNERIYWLHSVLIPHITKEFKENFEQLERMYRLLKNYGNVKTEVKKPGEAFKDSWLYSDVHSQVARANLELKIAVSKCTNLDMFLDAAAMNKQELDLEILNRDIEDLVERITKCLNTAQSSQLKLKKLKSKYNPKPEKEEKCFEVEESAGIVTAVNENEEPETKDEVFYFHKTEDNEPIEPTADVTTGPGEKEKEATKVVLNELRRKLVKREDLMRERERQALSKTMHMEKVPEFPRQLKLEAVDLKGYISKIQNIYSKKLFRRYKIEKRSRESMKKYKLINECENEGNETCFNMLMFRKHYRISVFYANGKLLIKKWYKKPKTTPSTSEGISADESSSNKSLSENNVEFSHKNINDYKVSKRDLELSPSSSDTDFDKDQKEIKLLRDIRRNRVARKKNFPIKRVSVSIEQDESLKPVEYSFGTGMALASVLQVNRPNLVNFAQEEVFIGDGEISGDSGNDADA